MSALSDAGGLIDSYISARYVLPLSVVPQALAQQCCAIAFITSTISAPPTKRACAMKMPCAGCVMFETEDPLGTDSAGDVPESEDYAQVISDPLVFSRDQKGFI